MRPAGRFAALFFPLAIGAAFPACSTYFNMFYNAESAFDQGYALHKKAMRSFPDSIVTQPPPEARTKYDRAIEKAAKVLEVYPRNKKWHDDAYYLLGKSYFYEKETGKALRWFNQLIEEFPGSPFVPEAYVYIAKADILEDNLDKAEEVLAFALRKYPFLDRDQAISLLFVESAIRKEGKSQAVDRLEEARRSVKSGEKRFNMLVRAASLCMDLQQFDRAAALLGSVQREGRRPAQLYRVDRDLVTCYAETDSLEKALKLLSVMKSTRSYSQYSKEMLFHKAQILARLGKVDEAIEAFQQVTGGRIIDTVAAQADTSTLSGRAWYELGLLYQKRKGDYLQAEEYYRLSAGRRGRDTVSAPPADRRRQAMKKLKEWRATVAGKDTLEKFKGDWGELLFKIGELFCHELDEPDSACRVFLSLADDTAASGGYAPKALCAAAHILRGRGDTVRADSLFSLVIERFPGSDYVAVARKGMGPAAPDAATRKEEAARAFRNAEKQYLAGEDLKEAVRAYYDVYRQYPELETGQKALFAAAWITDNELQKKKTAKSLYEKLCERYAKSDYCINQAKPKLKAVTDTLEALRRERGRASGGKPEVQASASPAVSGATAVSQDKAPEQTAEQPPRMPDMDSSMMNNPKMNPRMMMPPTRRNYGKPPQDSEQEN